MPVVGLCADSVYQVSKQSRLAALLRCVRLIVWDETTMANKHHLDCVDCTLRDLTGNEQPFGGNVVLFCGDFRQVLPLMRHAERAKVVSITIKRWNQWNNVRQLHAPASEYARTACMQQHGRS